MVRLEDAIYIYISRLFFGPIDITSVVLSMQLVSVILVDAWWWALVMECDLEYISYSPYLPSMLLVIIWFSQSIYTVLSPPY